MTRSKAHDDQCEAEALILQSLVRKLVEKGLLSEDDVRALLLNAMKGLNIVVPSPMGPKAANDIIIEGS
ncbi:MAG: hypothetical protein WAM90_07925 [Rhodanobacter sp.]